MESFINTFFQYITSKLESKHWKLKSILFYILGTIVFQIPRFGYFINYLNHKEISAKYNAILLQKAEPFIRHNYSIGSHEEKIIFRLFIPLSMNFFSLNILSVYIIQVLVGILMLYMMLNYIYKSTDSRLIAFFFTLAFVFVYAGSASLIDVYGFYDSFAYAFVLFAFFSSNPLLIFLLILSSLYVDERAYIACIGIIVYQLFNQKNLKIIASVCIALIIAFLIRILLTHYCGLYLHPDQLLAKNTFLDNINNIGLATITVFKGFWFLIMITFVLLWVNRRYSYLVALVLYFGLLYSSSFIVYDMTRSMSYLVLIFPLTHNICNQYLEKKTLMKIYTFVVFLCIIIPTYLVQYETYYIHPLIFDIVKFIFK